VKRYAALIWWRNKQGGKVDTVQLDLFAPAVEIVVRQYASDCGPWHIVDYAPALAEFVKSLSTISGYVA